MENIKKPRRQRRTKVALEKDVLNAVTSLIEEVGFANVTLTAVAQKAKIEASVFYRRYDNLDELFEEYTRRYDYWFSGITELMPTDLSDENSLKWILRTLTQALYRNKVMQRLLIWELSDENNVTIRTANLREKVNESLIKLVENKFEGSGFDMSVLVSLLISGVYYLILHKNISNFCGVDFNSRSGKDRLEATLDKIVSIVFAEIKQKQGLKEIADKLRAEGVSEEVIQKCL